jgi:hypothetical protein
MFRTGISLLLAGVVALPCLAQPAPPAGAKQPAPAAAADAALKDITADLREARELIKKVTDRPTRDRLELLLTRSELKATELQRSLVTLAPPSRPAAASAEDFAAFLKTLKGQSFDDGKAAFVENYGRSRSFSSAQVRDMLKEFSFDDGRSKAALALYSRVTDPENFYQALEAFSFDSNRKALQEKLKGK